MRPSIGVAVDAAARATSPRSSRRLRTYDVIASEKREGRDREVEAAEPEGRQPDDDRRDPADQPRQGPAEDVEVPGSRGLAATAPPRAKNPIWPSDTWPDHPVSTTTRDPSTRRSAPAEALRLRLDREHVGETSTAATEDQPGISARPATAHVGQRASGGGTGALPRWSANSRSASSVRADGRRGGSSAHDHDREDRIEEQGARQGGGDAGLEDAEGEART